MRQGEDNLQQGKTWKNGYWPTSLGPGVQFPSGVANWCLDHKERRSLCSFFPGGVFFPTRQSPSRLETQNPIICPFLVFPVSERMSFFGVLRPLHRSLDSHRSVVGPVTGSSAWPGRACRCSARLMSKFQEPNMVVGIVRKPNPQAS